jgi:hypothetical protein
MLSKSLITTPKRHPSQTAQRSALTAEVKGKGGGYDTLAYSCNLFRTAFCRRDGCDGVFETVPQINTVMEKSAPLKAFDDF